MYPTKAVTSDLPPNCLPKLNIASVILIRFYGSDAFCLARLHLQMIASVNVKKLNTVTQHNTKNNDKLRYAKLISIS